MSTAKDTRPAGQQADIQAMCQSRFVIEHLTSRWGVLVLIRLLDRPHRFAELRRSIRSVGHVSEKMLTQTLQNLERDGLVRRDAKPVLPPHVDYSLTDLGREAAEQVRALALWTHERLDRVQEAQEKYDSAKGR
jgi:DNA-binding HxlR family transcriptional regulator